MNVALVCSYPENNFIHKEKFPTRFFFKRGSKLLSLVFKIQWLYCYFHSVATINVSYSSQPLLDDNGKTTAPQRLEWTILESFFFVRIDVESFRWWRLMTPIASVLNSTTISRQSFKFNFRDLSSLNLSPLIIPTVPSSPSLIKMNHEVDGDT